MALNLPAGFVLDQPQAGPSNLPPGFVLDKPQSPVSDPGTLARVAEVGKRALGGIEGVANTAANAISAPIQGLAGIGAGAYNALSNIGSASQSTDAGNAAQSVMQAVQAHTPQFAPSNPSMQEGQQAAQGTLGAIASLPQTAVDKTFDLTGKAVNAIPGASQFINAHPGITKSTAALQGIGDVAANIAPMLMGGKAGEPPKPSPVDITPFVKARQMGLSIPPSFAATKGAKTTIGPAVEGIVGGAPKMTVDASIKNQPVITAKAVEDIPSMEPGTEPTPENIEAAKKPYEAVYQKVAKLGNIDVDPQYAKNINAIEPNLGRSFPKAQNRGVNADIAELKDTYSEPNFDAADALQHIKELRDNARSNYSAAANPTNKNASSLKRLADAQNSVADALIDQMDRWADSRPEEFNISGLGKQFRDARMNLAKIYTLEDVIKPGTTDVSAAALAKKLNSGKKLSGNALTIAELYNNFKPAMQDAGPLRNKVPVNRLDAMVGTAGAGFGAFQHSVNPVLGAAGYILAPPLARKGLLSNAYQNAMLPKPTSPLLGQVAPGSLAAAIMAGNKQ